MKSYWSDELAHWRHSQDTPTEEEAISQLVYSAIMAFVMNSEEDLDELSEPALDRAVNAWVDSQRKKVAVSA